MFNKNNNTILRLTINVSYNDYMSSMLYFLLYTIILLALSYVVQMTLIIYFVKIILLSHPIMIYTYIKVKRIA